MREIKLISLSVLSAMVLAACGGGSGGGTSSTTVPTDTSAGPLSKYVGVWNQGCNNHEFVTTTLAATSGGTSLSVTQKTEFFENTNCTGAVVATGTYAQPFLVAQHVRTEPNASVKMLTGETVTASIDVANATASGGAITFVGSAVSSSVVNGKTVWRIAFKEGTLTQTVEIKSGTSQGAFMLRNGEFYTLQVVGNSTTSFAVESRYIRS